MVSPLLNLGCSWPEAKACSAILIKSGVFYRVFPLFLNDFYGIATEAQVEAVGAVLASGAGLHGAQYPDAHVRAVGVEAHRVACRPRWMSALYAKRPSGQGEVGFAGRGKKSHKLSTGRST